MNSHGEVPHARRTESKDIVSNGERAAVLCGIGAWTPPDVVTNDDLARQLNTSDGWIVSRTGVQRRHVV